MSSPRYNVSSFSFVYFSRPVSNRESVWYIDLHRKEGASDRSGCTAAGTDTATRSPCLDRGVDSMDEDSDSFYAEENILPHKFSPLKCESIAPAESRYNHRGIVIFLSGFCLEV